MEQTKKCKECKKYFNAYDEYDDTCFDCARERSCQICLDCEEWFLSDGFRALCGKCSEKSKKKVDNICKKK